MSKDGIARGSFTVVNNYPESERASVMVKVTDPNAKLMKGYTASEETGTFSFTSVTSGEHNMCFSNTGISDRRITMEFTVGVDAKDYAELIKRDQLQPLEVRALDLLC